MSKDETPLFRGDYTGGEKPHTWFRRLEGKFDYTTTLPNQLYRFEKSLYPGRKAEQWYQALPAADKTTWPALYAAFTLKWPLPTIVEPTRDELMARLHNTKLEESQLGCLIGDEDKVYSHIKWAADIRVLTDALEDDKGNLIHDVRRGLPLLVRRLLPASGMSTWATFLAAITTLSIERIEDELESEARFRQLAQVQSQDWQKDISTLTSQFQSSAIVRSPARALPPSYQPRPTYAGYLQPQQQPALPIPQMLQRQAPPHMTPGNHATPRQNTPRGVNAVQRYTPPVREGSNPFLTTTPAPVGSLFNPRTPTNAVPQTPSRPGNAELARRAVELSVVYVATPEGNERYKRTLAGWEAMHAPNREVDFLTPPYPLTPGTENIGSHECFKCGHVGHIARMCEAPQQVNQREQRWRGQIGRLLFGRRIPDPVGISQINVHVDDLPLPYEPAIYDAASLDFEEDCEDSGNGQEACA